MIQAEIGSGARRELADAAEQLVRARYTQKFSLDALADAVHVDKSYLLRTFKKMKGTTLLAFHNQLRCEAAKELLTQPELPIAHIASSVGFVSPAHFSQIFKKYTGTSPSDYRKEYFDSLKQETED